MLEITKQFKITTKVENDEMLSDYLEWSDVVIEQEHYAEYPWLEDGEALMTLDCRIRSDKFDELVEGLKELFKDQQAIISW